MNNFTNKLGFLLLLFLMGFSLRAEAKFNFYKLAQDLDSNNNTILFKAKRQFQDYEYLEALLKQKLARREDLGLVMKVIKVIHVKNLLPELLKSAKGLSSYGSYETINSLKDKENLPIIDNFYHEQIKHAGASDNRLKEAYVDFYEYNNKRIEFPLVLIFLQDQSLDLRVKVAQYFYSAKEKYTVQEVSQFSNKSLGLGPYQLRLEVLESLARLSKGELRKLKIDTSKCRGDLNERVRQACKNIRKYF